MTPAPKSYNEEMARLAGDFRKQIRPADQAAYETEVVNFFQTIARMID